MSAYTVANQVVSVTWKSHIAEDLEKKASSPVDKGDNRSVYVLLASTGFVVKKDILDVLVLDYF